jgi:hypothetical protein
MEDRMTTTIAGFGGVAKGLSRSPLGIIALFIVLIYGVAALVLGLTADNLDNGLKWPLVWFLALFPCLVLLTFAWLVARYHTHLYAPSDFSDQKLFLELQAKVTNNEHRIQVLAEVTPNVRIPDIPAAPSQPLRTREEDVRSEPAHSDDPQAGRWGGHRETNFRVVMAGQIKPLRSDPMNFQVPLEVRSTDPQHHPLTGRVRFHLHDSFSPDVEDVTAVEGVARLTLVAYGAFTVGVEIEDGTQLEINLADDDIQAPRRFKES